MFGYRLPELHPAQQGLKQGLHIPDSILIALPELHPAQQGLKPLLSRRKG